MVRTFTDTELNFQQSSLNVPPKTLNCFHDLTCQLKISELFQYISTPNLNCTKLRQISSFSPHHNNHSNLQATELYQYYRPAIELCHYHRPATELDHHNRPYGCKFANCIGNPKCSIQQSVLTYNIPIQNPSDGMKGAKIKNDNFSAIRYHSIEPVTMSTIEPLIHMFKFQLK